MKKRSVPKLSLLSYTEGNKREKKEFVDNIFQGLKEYGFIVLTEHTVSREKINRAYECIQDFFHLPQEIKEQYLAKTVGGQRGYTPYKTEHAKDYPVADLKEFWHVGRETKFLAKNLWPKEVPQFKKALEELYESMDKAATILLSAVGEGLDVKADFFSRLLKGGDSILRAIYYPSTKGEDTIQSLRAAPHADINLITLLVGATDTGLQLLDRNGTWLEVQSTPEHIVVDVGDMLEIITNGILPATVHRVVNPDNVDSERFSLPYFVHPQKKALLTPLPSCIGTGKARYNEITAEEFLNRRLKEIGLY